MLRQETDVWLADRMILDGSPDPFVLDRVKHLLKVDRCNPHICSSFLAFLGNESVFIKMVCRLEIFPKPTLVGKLVLVELAVQSVAQHRGE